MRQNGATVYPTRQRRLTLIQPLTKVEISRSFRISKLNIFSDLTRFFTTTIAIIIIIIIIIIINRILIEVL